MIKNPPNPRANLESQHHTLIGKTGSGKTQFLRQRSGIPEKGARVVLFDPSRDHAKGTHYFNQRADFARALSQADASGKGFRIAYDGDRSPEVYEWWCKCCIAILDGRKMTYMLTEELAAVSKNANKALPHHQWLMNESRKYGGVYIATTQFPTMVSKAVYYNSRYVTIGMLAPDLVPRYARNFGIPAAELAALKPLEFIQWSGAEWKKIKINYRR